MLPQYTRFSRPFFIVSSHRRGRIVVGFGLPYIRVDPMQNSENRRLVSLDAFRGAVIAGMLVVNNVPWNSATPRQLMHAAWGQGVTFTDMILPWFVLAMGVAVTQSHAARGPSWLRIWRVVRRAVLLVA